MDDAIRLILQREAEYLRFGAVCEKDGRKMQAKENFVRADECACIANMLSNVGKPITPLSGPPGVQITRLMPIHTMKEEPE